MRDIKKAFVTVVVATMMFVLAGCGLFGKDPTDCVQKMLDAYASGDAKKFASYFEENDRMHYLVKAMDGTGVGQMQEVYERAYKLTQNAEFTVVGESAQDEYVTVRIKSVDYSEALHNAMLTAMKDNGNDFEDAPTWMMAAFDTPGEPVEVEVDVRVQANGQMYDEHFNEEFFNVLTGGFYEYIGCVMASGSISGNRTYLLGVSDKVIYSLDEHHESIAGTGVTSGNVNGVITHFAAKYEGLKGVEAGGNLKENMARMYLIVDYQNAPASSLQQLGLLSGGDTSEISLDLSVKGMKAMGYSCKTTDFGVGVESGEDE